MRDSINYTLNYFIMRMSGTKPIKNTVRKAPIRQEMASNPTEMRTNPDVTSTNNNRAGVGLKGKKTYGKEAAAKRTDIRTNKPTSKETIARREASKKAMDTYKKSYATKKK